jgi:SAM-dependent methyltransferase
MKTREEIILEWVKGPDVLDVGCTDHVVRNGSVYWLHQYLSEKLPNVVGIDISEENLEKMRVLGYRNLYQMNAETFSLNQTFDTIVAGELIEHLSNPGQFLDRARAHLKPNGRLILTTQYPFTLLHILYAYMKYPRTCQNPEHTCWFCIENMRSLVNRHGFKEHYFDLVMDYRLDASSWKYRVFARMVIAFRFIIPKRVRNNTMLFVLELA